MNLKLTFLAYEVFFFVAQDLKKLCRTLMGHVYSKRRRRKKEQLRHLMREREKILLSFFLTYFFRLFLSLSLSLSQTHSLILIHFFSNSLCLYLSLSNSISLSKMSMFSLFKRYRNFIKKFF